MNESNQYESGQRPASVLRRLRRDERGVTAIEFALVAAPFLAFIFQTIEVAFVYGGTVSLEHALEKTARTIRVGGAVNSKDAFKNAVCAETVLLQNCVNKLIVDVRTIPSLANAGSTNVMSGYSNPSGDLNGPTDPGNPDNYSRGNGGDAVLVNVFYKWDILAQLPLFYSWETGATVSPLSNQSDGSRVMSATVAFQNEPFTGQANP